MSSLQNPDLVTTQPTSQIDDKIVCKVTYYYKCRHCCASFIGRVTECTEQAAADTLIQSIHDELGPLPKQSIHGCFVPKEYRDKYKYIGVGDLESARISLIP